MNNTAWYLFELAVNFYQQFIIVKTLAMCLGHRFDEKKHIYYSWIATGILFVELSWLNNLIPFEGMGVLLSILLLYIYAEICLSGSRLQKLFWSTSIMVIVIAVTAIVLNLESSIIGCTYMELVKNQTLERFVGVIAVQIVIFLVLWIVAKVFGTKRRYMLRWKEGLPMLLVPLVSIFTMSFVMGIVVNAREHLSAVQQKFAVMAVLGILVTNIMVYVLYRKLQREQERRFSYEMRKQMIHSQEKEVRELQALYLSIRKARHNLKNQIMTVLSMLKEKQYDKAKEYLERYNTEVLEEIEGKIFCENDVINHLINAAYRRCQKHGIRMNVWICNPVPAISDIDLSVILGNALDNAMEGCASETEKGIRLDIRQTDNFLIIQVENTIIASVLKANPHLKTTKINRSMHGLGILSMQEVAEKYQGSVAFNEENGYFCCNIVLDIEDYAV